MGISLNTETRNFFKYQPEIFSAAELGINDKCPGVRSMRELLSCVPGPGEVKEEVTEEVSRPAEWNLYTTLLMKDDEGSRFRSLCKGRDQRSY